MKRFSFIILSVIVASMPVSCQPVQPHLNRDGGKMSLVVNLTAPVMDTETKTTLNGNSFLWGTDEYAMLYINDGQDKFFESKFSSADRGKGQGSTSFDFDVEVEPAENYTLGGIYPYSAVTSKAKKDCQVTLPALQNANSDTYDPSAFIMVMKAETLAGMPEVWNASFRRVVALNCLALTGVKEKIVSVEISASGKSIAGPRMIDLAGGNDAPASGGQSTVTVNYVSALDAGSASIWFTSWGCDLAAGDKLNITVYGESQVYTKDVAAESAGILFKEGTLCNMGVDFASVSGRPYNMKDFAKAYAGVLDIWQSNWAEEGDNGISVFTGHFIPEGSAVVKLTAVDNWTAASDVSWVTVEPASGISVIDSKIRITAPKNDSRAPRTATVTFSCGSGKATVTVFQDDPSVEKIRKDIPNKAFYKDLFMDSGCNLSSYRTMPVVDYLSLDYEYFYTERESGATSSEIALQTKAYCGSSDDLNGVFLYPDGEPRFKIIYVNGGQAANHGNTLGEEGRANFRKFVANGGCYIGSCAGAFLATAGLTDEGKPRSNYLGLWPGYADNISLIKYDVIYEIPDDSPILDYYDFGGDHRIMDMKHYNGPYFSQWDSVEDTEILAYNNAPGCQLDTYPAIIAYKADEFTGRIIPSGGHPEQFPDGERRDLMAALVRYAFDGQGVAKVKATLENGEARTMDKSTSDNMPEYTMIGDKQCHHFVFSLPEGAKNIKIRLESLKDCKLSLFLAKGTFAFREDAQYKVENNDSIKELSFATMPQNGLWYIGVQSEETVTHTDGPNGYSYSGKTWLLNGAPYRISVSWE